uniref:NADH-ubiquinone oxidoreductase chain 2 n=2 Tax=Ledra TaxID=1310350 RepID=A0A6B9QER6_9HEMI|nr:NADH dehydrogenase subunit 2 [Ledra auditura]UGK73308.1 NADH dehydrogenase subunit 2 [Ledra trigona]
MFLNSSKLLFLVFMTVGVMISFSCSSWIMIWSGMEVFLLSFIPYFCNFSFVSSESSMKYFLVQGLSSSIFLFSIFFLVISENFLMKSFFCFSLLLKLGCAPFHSWVIGVIPGMSYDSLFIFLTFSSLPPLFLLTYISFNLSFFVSLSLLFGSVGGLNCTSLKKILGFSSIFNLGFIIYLSCFFSLLSVYFFVYSFMLFFLVLFLFLYKIDYLNQLFLSGLSYFSSFSFWIIFLSLGGMPPMLGFFIKMFCLEFCLMNSDFVISSFMVFFSLVVMFFYMRCFFVCLLVYFYMMKWNFSMNFISLNFFSFLSFFLFPFLFLISGLV